MPHKENQFDHILCCTVLHFTQDEAYFVAMFRELVRVLKPLGSLLARMDSAIDLDGGATQVTYKKTVKKMQVLFN